MNPGRIAEIEKMICAHLRVHPEARDTLEGIIHWWLLEQRLEQSTLEVKTVMDSLVKRKKVVAIRAKDGQTHYCLKEAQSARVRKGRGHLDK